MLAQSSSKNMKSFLKISLLILGVLFLCGKFFEYLDHRKEAQKDPFIHLSCRLAHEKKMTGNPCAMCFSRHEAEVQRKISNVLKKWERARGKAFSASSNQEIDEFLQILKNHKVLD
jgi:hypothetical protein